MVPITTILFLAISGIVCFALPIGLYIYLRKRYKTAFMPMIAGAITFFVFGIILKSIFTSILFPTEESMQAILAVPFLYAVVFSALAGVFEETGRFVTFKMMKKNYNSVDNALAYGAGHGGIEAILLVGVSMFINMFIAITIGALGAETIIEDLGTEVGDIRNVLYTFENTPSITFLYPAIERISAFVYHISASVLVYLSVSKNKIYYYLLAIVFHTILNIPAGLYQAGFFGENMLLTEGIIFIISALIALAVYCIYKKEK